MTCERKCLGEQMISIADECGCRYLNVLFKWKGMHAYRFKDELFSVRCKSLIWYMHMMYAYQHLKPAAFCVWMEKNVVEQTVNFGAFFTPALSVQLSFSCCNGTLQNCRIVSIHTLVHLSVRKKKCLWIESQCVVCQREKVTGFSVWSGCLSA